MVNTTTMAAKQGRQRITMVGVEYISKSKFEVSWSTSASPSSGLDLAGKQRLWRRYAQSWIMGSSTVWGDIQSVWGTEYVRSYKTEICCWSQRRWSKRVSPYRSPLSFEAIGSHQAGAVTRKPLFQCISFIPHIVKHLLTLGCLKLKTRSLHSPTHSDRTRSDF